MAHRGPRWHDTRTIRTSDEMPIDVNLTYIATLNDENGNPRRGWKVSNAETGEFLGFIDEGYNGNDYVRAIARKKNWHLLESDPTGMSRTTVTVKFYKTMKANEIH